MVKDDVQAFLRTLLHPQGCGARSRKHEPPRRAAGSAWPGTSYLKTCDICGRRILVGERSLIAEDGQGSARLLCSLCARSAISGEGSP